MSGRVNVHASGETSDGYWRKGWRADAAGGPWFNLIGLPPVDTLVDNEEGLSFFRVKRSYMLVFGWRPYVSVSVEVTP